MQRQCAVESHTPTAMSENVLCLNSMQVMR
jgi:hypothetical protein